IVAGALFPEVLQRALPVGVPAFDRALALETGLERAWQRTQPIGINPFQELFLERWDAKSATPALLLNTTKVENGRRVLVSPFLMRPGEDIATKLSWFYDRPGAREHRKSGMPEPPIVQDIKLSTAAALSARYPWILPAATVPYGDTFYRVVDGGL